MKRVHKKDLKVMEAAMRYVDSFEDENEYDCDDCPMSRENNKTGKLCYEYLFAIAGGNIFKEANNKSQHDVIRYVIKMAKQQSRNVKI